ncbi:MAG: pentapeptide repeat-containing protein [Chloroflexota bacterium]|nr:pentapeptide repeat-containing protein [Chloroflexota bacterium]
MALKPHFISDITWVDQKSNMKLNGNTSRLGYKSLFSEVIITVQRLGSVYVLTLLTLFSIILITLSYNAAIVSEQDDKGMLWWSGALLNLGSGFVGAIVTFILFDQIIRVREEVRTLIVKMRGKDIDEARFAIEYAREKDWFKLGYFREERFDNAILSEIDLEESNFVGASFIAVKMNYSNFGYSQLMNTVWQYSELKYSTFSNTNLVNANFRGSDLSFADLTFADLRNADLSFVNLSGANLLGANLNNATLREAQFDLTTILPTEYDFFGNDGEPAQSSTSYKSNMDLSRYTNQNRKDALIPSLIRQERDKPDLVVRVFGFMASRISNIFGIVMDTANAIPRVVSDIFRLRGVQNENSNDNNDEY